MDNGDVLNLKVNIAEGEYRYEATDEKGNSYNLYEDETAERMKFSDKKYQTIEIEEKKIESKKSDLQWIYYLYTVHRTQLYHCDAGRKIRGSRCESDGIPHCHAILQIG